MEIQRVKGKKSSSPAESEARQGRQNSKIFLPFCFAIFLHFAFPPFPFMSLVIHLLSNSLAIYIAAYLVPKITFTGDWKIILIAGLIMGIINFFIKPVLKLLAFPLIILSLGFFTIVINMFLLWIVDLLIQELVIQGILALFFGTIIISVTNVFTSALTRH